MVARFLFFFLFNLICSISTTYVINDELELVKKCEEMRLNQIELTELSEKIYLKMTK